MLGRLESRGRRPKSRRRHPDSSRLHLDSPLRRIEPLPPARIAISKVNASSLFAPILHSALLLLA
jgi:hypothetical protein